MIWHPYEVTSDWWAGSAKAQTFRPVEGRPYGTNRRHDRAWVQAGRHLGSWDKPADPADDTEPPLDIDVDSLPEPPTTSPTTTNPNPKHSRPEPDPVRELVIAANTAAWQWWNARTADSWVPD